MARIKGSLYMGEYMDIQTLKAVSLHDEIINNSFLALKYNRVFADNAFWEVRVKHLYPELHTTCSEIPDLFGIGWGATYVFEVKTSIEDFKKDFKKPFRAKNLGIGDYRYYITDESLDLCEMLKVSDWGYMQLKKEKCSYYLEVKKPSNKFIVDRNEEIEFMRGIIYRYDIGRDFKHF